MGVFGYRVLLAGLTALGLAVVAGTGSQSRADSLDAALVRAYQSNPQLNAQRAAVRAADENVSGALAGYRPRISANASTTEQYLDTTSRTATASRNVYSTLRSTYNLSAVGATLTQPLFNGFQTSNRTRQAEAQTLSARESLRSTEQSVLLNAVIAYMNLLRDTAILELQRSNVRVLEAQLRQTRDRFNVGEVTRTDVAQAESRVAAGQSAMQNAEGNYTTSRAIYRQVIGSEPGRLAPATPVDRFLTRSREAAVIEGRANNPAVTAAMYNVDAAQALVKVAEGALYPVLNFQAGVSKNWGSPSSSPSAASAILETLSGTAGLQLTAPIYQGGSEYAAIRQAKETLGQRRLDLDVAREQAQATVVQSWAQLDTAKAQIESTNAQVRAAEIALNGVREEARVGQRTTLDVLNAQQELVNARVALVTAQRDRVVTSYTALASLGRLSPQVLRLHVANYDPVVHYNQIRDKWFGVRTPDGR